MRFELEEPYSVFERGVLRGGRRVSELVGVFPVPQTEDSIGVGLADTDRRVIQVARQGLCVAQLGTEIVVITGTSSAQPLREIN